MCICFSLSDVNKYPLSSTSSQRHPHFANNSVCFSTVNIDKQTARLTKTDFENKEDYLKSENSIYRDGAVSYFQLDSVSSFGRFVTIARRGPTLQPSLSKQYQDFLFVWKSHSDKFQHVWRTLLTFCERLWVFRVKHLKSVGDETHQPLWGWNSPTPLH